ncbi:hypothetical protein BT93_J0340 [Corymbia citriodora subsp. variegata]|nr:hypothetical protein BT93_J0340 [Corymbia citriodora subsp. variegata]
MDHRAIEIDELQDAALEDNAAGSVAGSMGGDQFESMTKWKPFMPNGLTSPPRNYDEAGPGDAPARSHNETVTYCLARVRRRLGERERRFRAGTSSCTIFRISPTLCGINPKAEQLEIVSIGPYHRGQDHLLEFEEHKWFFLRWFLHRTGDFVEMMLLDSCFVLELLLHIFRSDDAIDEDGPIFTRPWIIPILIRDLLKLENQVPYFLLKSLFNFSSSTRFDLAYPRPVALLQDYGNLQCKHLLDLFYLTLFPTNPVPHNYPQNPSGIKFRSRETENFLDMSFRKQVLEMPSITINDFTTTELINCVALEQCQENSSKYITNYVSFMHCLINQPKDVSLLCSDGIITRFSHDYQYVANLFNKLGKSIIFNVHDCYLPKQFEELESYCYSNWANMMRTYFSSPWSVISFFSAFLVIVLTATQNLFAVLGYRFH